MRNWANLSSAESTAEPLDPSVSSTSRAMLKMGTLLVSVCKGAGSALPVPHK